jgi:hypothetical protein
MSKLSGVQVKVVITMGKCDCRLEKVQTVQKLNHAVLARLSIDDSYKLLLEEAVPQCTGAIDSPIGVDFKAKAYQLLQAFKFS